MTWGSNTYVKSMMDNFKNNFGFEPSNQHAAMQPDCKPEIDTTEICTDTEKAQYWKWIGEIQWAVVLGQIDIMYATIVFSRYRPAPHRGHLSKIHHLYGYLKKYT